MLERLNREIKRRTLLVRIFPDEASGLRLVRALAVEIDEESVDENRYLDMKLLREWVGTCRGQLCSCGGRAGGVGLDPIRP